MYRTLRLVCRVKKDFPGATVSLGEVINSDSALLYLVFLGFWVKELVFFSNELSYWSKGVTWLSAWLSEGLASWGKTLIFSPYKLSCEDY